MRHLSFFAIVFVLFQVVSASGQTDFCAQRIIHEKLWKERPEMERRHRQFDEQIRQFLRSENHTHAPVFATYTLPVVVHIIHDNGAENIPDAQVLQGIQDLNDAYANAGYYDSMTGVDTEIEFCLARRDPDGNATTGITRDQSPLTEMTLETDDITVKDLNRWDPTQYINIWLVRAVNSSTAGAGVVGYAYFPTSHGDPEDGIMMEADWFGSNPGQSSVIVHEMGHYLGVYHTFQGGCANADCLADGDQVCDTPPDQSTAAVPCNGSMNSCTTDSDSGFATDQDDMFWNYMDYGDWNCYSAFTAGQVDRMHFSIENPRVSLQGSLACLDPCMSPLTAAFTPNASSVEVGGNVIFTNGSSNATTASWEIDGGSFSNNFNANFTFNQVGTFEICLTVGNADPNCFDRICENITVTCPVMAEFTTDNFYPMPGEVVNYANASLNATEFEWQVDGVPSANTLDFSTSFPTVGVYEVCLVAGDGLCEAEYCLPVFVSENTPTLGECDTSFLKAFGTPGTLEFGHSIIAAPNGGFFIGGGRGTEAVITLLDTEANLVWTRQFNPTFDADDFIWKIKLDSDGNLIGIGQTAPVDNNIEVYAFRYDWQNDQMLWLNELDIADPAGEGYYDILEKTPGGNFLIFGQTTPIGNATSDALLLEVQRNTGLNVFAKIYSLGWQDVFRDAMVANGSIYATGPFTGGPTSTSADKRRPGLTHLDLDGDQIWTRLYLQSIAPGESGYFTPTALIDDNGLVIFGTHDPLSGVPEADLFLYRTDYAGNLEWAKHIDIPISNIEISWQLLNLPDGYLCMGNLVTATDGNIFIFKTDKQGDLVWARDFGGADIETGHDCIWQNGQVFLTGRTTNSDPAYDVFLASLNPDGSATAADTCNLLNDLDLTVTDWPNPYDGQHDLTEVNLTANFFTNSETTQTVLLEQQIICANPCPQDSCDFVPDAVLVEADGTCNGDSLHVTFTLCSEGSFELPAGTPVSFYDGDPTSGSPDLVATIFLDEKIKRDSCRTLSVSIPAAPFPIFILANDAGAGPFPIDLMNGMTDTNTEECNYTNNLGSFDFNYTPPPLDLGPDIVVCENGVVTLDAGPGFYSYRWQDGDDGQTYTAFFPGTYSVEVTDSCGGVQTDEITITIDPASIADLGPDTLICEGDTLVLSLDGFDRVEWFPKNMFPCDTCSSVGIFPMGDSIVEVIAVGGTNLGCFSVDTILVGATQPVFTRDTLYFCLGDVVEVFGQPVGEAGEYVAVFPRAEGCDSTHTIWLEAIANLFLQLPADITLTLGDSVRLNPVTNGIDLMWQWTPSEWLSCDDCKNPYARPFETTLYTVVATDPNGCEASDDIQLFVKKDRGIYIPNAFSPNGDGINDIFHIYAGGNVEEVLEFEIFDRWGERVFMDSNFPPNDPLHGWDGTFRAEPMDPAVFVFKAKVEYVDGQVEVFYGDVTLVR